MQGQYGVLTLNQSGTWSYELDNELPAVQALSAIDTVFDNFQVQVIDTGGDIGFQSLSIAVQGANDLVI